MARKAGPKDERPIERLKAWMIAQADAQGIFSIKRSDYERFGLKNANGFGSMIDYLRKKGFIKHDKRGQYQLVKATVPAKPVKIPAVKKSAPLVSPPPPQAEVAEVAVVDKSYLYLTPAEEVAYEFLLDSVTLVEDRQRVIEGTVHESCPLQDEESREDFISKMIEAGILSLHGTSTKGRIFNFHQDKQDFWKSRVKVVPEVENLLSMLQSQKAALQQEIDAKARAIGVLQIMQEMTPLERANFWERLSHT